jgi:hypothetical protein
MYVVAASEHCSVEELRERSPGLWRDVRRFNPPVQLALASALEVSSKARNPETALLVSLAPCQAGSPELFEWAHSLLELHADGDFTSVRMNPTHTLHAVDNLALSALGMALKNHAYCVGLGGSPGQAWVGLEIIQERFASGYATEAILVAGDQESALRTSSARGVALLLSSVDRSFESTNRTIRFSGIIRTRLDNYDHPRSDACHGLSELLSLLHDNDLTGRLTYDVPPDQGDGYDRVTIVLEVV